MTQLIGTIRNISAGRAMLDLNVFDDGILITRGDLKAMTVRVAGATALGARGLEAGDQLARSIEQGRDERIAGASLEELLAQHPENRFLPLDTIASARMSHPWFPPIYRLDLEMTDGRRERFEWKRLHNEPKVVASLLERALPGRFVDGG